MKHCKQGQPSHHSKVNYTACTKREKPQGIYITLQNRLDATRPLTLVHCLPGLPPLRTSTQLDVIKTFDLKGDLARSAGNKEEENGGWGNKLRRGTLERTSVF